MANYSNLKTAIAAAIKANGNQEITGQVLQGVLTSIVSVIGANYTFAGVATPATNPGTPDQNVVYMASKAGTYTNFNGTVLPAGISLLMWNGTWTSKIVLCGDGGVFDISEYKSSGGTLATFADLAAALDGGNNIPASARKGGMSVKFVQSSDNKYVQYRLMSDTWSINTEDWSFCGDSVYVENPEWIYVLLDADKRILGGLKYDGSVEWSIGVPTPVKTYIDNAIAEIKNGMEGTDLDGLNKIIAFLSEFSTSDTLKDLLDSKVDKEEGKSLINEEYAEGVQYIENPEFVYVKTDAEGKILWAIKTNGDIYYGAGVPQQVIDYINEKIAELSLDEYEDMVAFLNDLEKGDKTLQDLLDEKVDKEEGKSLIDEGVADSISTTEDPEGRLEITLDAEEKIVSYRKDDGTLAENAGFETPIAKIEQLEVGNIEMSEKDKAKFIGNDSNPYLRIDRIDIISSLLIVSGNAVYPLNTTKNEVGDVNTDDVVFKYTSKNGGFTDNCSIAYQGNSSLRWTKKGFAVDLANKHRFKDWIEHDSFNIKGYATDWMHVREYIGTTIYEQMMQHRPIGHRRPWELYNDFKDSDYQNGCPSSALGHSDQHPVELYINGNYWGLYSISLKKKKENYEMKKNNAKHIMLDATGGFSCAKNWFSWPGAEIRFPKEDKNKKKLLDKDLNNYDGDNPKELLGEGNPLYDPDNSTHVFCNTVKQKILAFYQFNHNINNSTTKEQIEAHWNIEEFIDSYLHTNFIGNSDVGGKNTLYCTWDGVHWAPLAYDFDLTFGCGWTNGINQVDVHLAFERYPASNRGGAFDCIPGAAQIKTLYQTEIEGRYKELRDTGIFTAENVSKIIKDWMIEVGEDVYKDDLDRWSGVYGNRGTKNMYGEEDVECYVNQQALYDYVVTRLTELDTLFNYISN